MNQLYHIFYPLINTSPMFKTLAPEEVDNLVNQYGEASRRAFVSVVINSCIANFKTTVVPALKEMSAVAADEMIINLYNGCVMLNPALDLTTWLTLTQSYNVFTEHTADEFAMTSTLPPMLDKGPSTNKKKDKPFSISYAKYINLEMHLNDRVVGQKEAVEQITSALTRAQAGLNDVDRPLAVFLFCGPSGVGKSYLAKELQKYLFGDIPLVRVDCGEYQHKHENQKLIGSASGYVGYENGGQLTNAVMKNPDTVVLIDEVEKAHPDIWNTFLKIFEDGFLTDNKGTDVSFRNTVIIMTSNLGNDKVAVNAFGRKTGFNNKIDEGYRSKEVPKRDYVISETEKAVRDYFKPELINRLDETVIFNYLTVEDYRKIAELEMLIVANKLSKKSMNISWNEDALDLLSILSGSAIQGARGMSITRRKQIEDPLADILLNSKHPKGTMFNITVKDQQFVIS